MAAWKAALKSDSLRCRRTQTQHTRSQCCKDIKQELHQPDRPSTAHKGGPQHTFNQQRSCRQPNQSRASLTLRTNSSSSRAVRPRIFCKRTHHITLSRGSHTATRSRLGFVVEGSDPHHAGAVRDRHGQNKPAYEAYQRQTWLGNAEEAKAARTGACRKGSLGCTWCSGSAAWSRRPPPSCRSRPWGTRGTCSDQHLLRSTEAQSIAEKAKLTTAGATGRAR